MFKYFLALIFLVLPAFSQTNATVAFVTVNPNGVACAVRAQMRLYIPSGVLYSCQNGHFGPFTTGSGGGTTNQNIRTIGFHLDGGGSALSGTITSCLRVPYAGTITGWYIDADQSGSITLAVRKVAFASYTGTAGFSGYTDVTGGGTAPVLSSAVTATFANLTSWVTAVTAGQEYCIQGTSPATITWANIYITVSAS